MKKTIQIGNRTFDLDGHTYIMGILNMTPDSFSDGGSYHSVDDALFRVEQMIKEGADLIDIGGESTRPGHTQISIEEEISRVTPVISAVKERFDVPVSIDSYKVPVVKAALECKADLVNDIWGLLSDEQMAKTIADADVTCCLMHNKADTEYTDIMKECVESLQHSVDLALRAGISKDRIILDPGIGFGKTYEQNLFVMKQIEEFNVLGYPMLLGTSRKSMIGLTLDLPVTERVEGTLVTSVLAVLAGWNFIRVHDIKENKRAVKMAEAIRDSKGF